MFSVADNASSCSRICSVSTLVRLRHAIIESPLSAKLKWATPSPGLNLSSMIALMVVPSRYTLESIWDVAVVRPPVHSCHELSPADVDVLALHGVEICPDDL